MDTATLPLPEFARRAGIPHRTARRWCASGELRARKNRDGEWHVAISELDRVEARRLETYQAAASAATIAGMQATLAQHQRITADEQLRDVCTRAAAADVLSPEILVELRAGLRARDVADAYLDAAKEANARCYQLAREASGSNEFAH